MDALCPRGGGGPDGWIPVYDAGYGAAQDEDGNEIPGNLAQERPRGLVPGGRRR